MIFKTQRLRVRHLQESDIEGFYDMQSNPNVMKHIKKFMNYEESKIELNRFMSYYADSSIFYNIWAIEDQNSHDFIGICGIYRNKKEEFEIAYRLREMTWGKGYGQEVAKQLIRYCFENLNLEEITAYVRSKNIGSIKILKKEMNFIKEVYSPTQNKYDQIFKITKKNWLMKREVEEIDF